MSYVPPGADRRSGTALDMRSLIAAGQAAYGGWCMLASMLSTELIAAQADWVCLDLQHGLIDESEMRALVVAAQGRDTPVVVRVPWNEPASIMRALDAGADGVIVPMVNSGAESAAAGAASRFPPQGTRSWGPVRPALRHPGYSPALANERAVCLVMVETVEAIAALDAILDAPNVDGVFLGPKDLAISHTGSPANALSDPELLAMAKQVADGCRARGLVAATICDTAEESARMRELGYTLLAVRPDTSLLAGALAAELAAARALQPDPKGDPR